MNFKESKKVLKKLLTLNKDKTISIILHQTRTFFEKMLVLKSKRQNSCRTGKTL